MVPAERARSLARELADAVVAFDDGKVVELCRIVLDEGLDPYAAVVEGLSPGMAEAGRLYEQKEYFVPELLSCSDALYAGLELLKPAILASARETVRKGTIVIGSVEGDIHDIGKNLVKMMFESADWTVHDLGRDVKLDRFVAEQERTNADIVALSALMTTSMLAMPRVIKMLRDRNRHVRVMVGGAPINPDVARKFGADGYAASAGTAVDEASRLVEELRKNQAASP